MFRKLMVTGLAAAATLVVAPSALACSNTPTGGTVTRAVDGRTYTLNVPSGLTGNAPLLLSLHGAGSTSQQDELFTGWTPFAAAHHFIVAYPQARPWSYSGVWDPYTTSSPDVGFLRDVASDIASTYCVDPKHVHVDGWSNGAVMSQRTACNAAGTFASVNSYAGGPPTAEGFAQACAPSRPIAISLIAGQEDFTYASLASNGQDWRTLDGCGATSTHTTDAYGSTDTYDCAAGTQVVARVVNFTSHNWPTGAAGEDQRNRIWSFFAAHPLP